MSPIHFSTACCNSKKSIVLAWALAFLTISQVVSAFYVPGTVRNTYEQGDLLPLKVVKTTSVKTQLPFDYYYFPFCRDKSKYCVVVG